jgi:Zn finger protein HypA/HybF involved in hydrogenase expression
MTILYSVHQRKDFEMNERLIQFQCEREGTLFYYQSNRVNVCVVARCPVCGSTRVNETGREYPALDETKEIPKQN